MIERTFLFVPGDRPEKFTKAMDSGADVTIIDLEDAVSPQRKSLARQAMASYLSEPKSKKVIIRVNGGDTPWYHDDIMAVRTTNIVGLMLPKTTGPEQIERVLETLGRPLEIIPLVETAKGIVNLPAISDHPAVQRMAFGSIDLQMDIGIPGSRDALLFARSQIVLHSKASELLPPIDGVTTNFRDPSTVLEDCRYARSLGFGGKLCIHPNQISPARMGLAPEESEVAWAEEVLNAVATETGAVSLNGKMIDAPVVEYAKRVLTMT
ncbi:CoA ester lyase [Rhizobium sp. CNPSo 3968]|uniref:HpcH/HpaI aldolase/citrate lyase family protein n=1 Tax=Rhizobium sp. CNPSo 3968 TaxID=3021408 RepID=UPI00254BD28B|nr:CoA ester lyase [Rhizobium sp. CNPSo 3968]MDK4717837.1 CoA ester lyase [Rhizobium sp. CNPSo 3968]